VAAGRLYFVNFPSLRPLCAANGESTIFLAIKELYSGGFSVVNLQPATGRLQEIGSGANAFD